MLTTIVLQEPSKLHGAPPKETEIGTVFMDLPPQLGMPVNHGLDVLVVCAVGLVLEQQDVVTIVVDGTEQPAAVDTHRMRARVVVQKIGHRSTEDAPLAMIAKVPQQAPPPRPALQAASRSRRPS